jgi:hypothetical protein
MDALETGLAVIADFHREGAVLQLGTVDLRNDWVILDDQNPFHETRRSNSSCSLSVNPWLWSHHTLNKIRQVSSLLKPRARLWLIGGERKSH